MVCGAAIMSFVGDMKAIDAELAAAGDRFGSIRTLLAEGVASLEQALGQKKSVVDYFSQVGIVSGLESQKITSSV